MEAHCPDTVPDPDTSSGFVLLLAVQFDPLKVVVNKSPARAVRLATTSQAAADNGPFSPPVVKTLETLTNLFPAWVCAHWSHLCCQHLILQGQALTLCLIAWG